MVSWHPVTPVGRFIALVKRESSLTGVKIGGTALTALSIALITTHLAGFVSSIVVSVLIPVFSLVLNEIYRASLVATRQTFSSESDDATNMSSSTTSDNDSHATARSRSEDAHTRNTYDTNNDTVTPMSSPRETVDEDRVSEPWWLRAYHGIADNSFLRDAVLFAVVALMTVAINFMVAHPSHNVNTTYKTVAVHREGLSTSDKNQIIHSAVSQADKHSDKSNRIVATPAPQPTSRMTTVVVSPTATPPPVTVSPSVVHDEQLAQQVNQLRAEEDVLRRQIDESRQANDSDKRRIAQLESRLETLSRQNRVPYPAVPGPTTTVTATAAPTPQMR